MPATRAALDEAKAANASRAFFKKAPPPYPAVSGISEKPETGKRELEARNINPGFSHPKLCIPLYQPPLYQKNFILGADFSFHPPVTYTNHSISA
jgi:hypothetical protein